MAARFERRAAEHDFLLELRFEEPLLEELIPGLRRLGHRLFEELMSRGIGLSEIRSGIAPGRGAVAVRGLPETEPEKEKLRLGPRVKEALRDGRPTPELIAFAQSERRLVKDLDRVYTERGHRFAVVELLPGRPVGEAVAELATDILAELRTSRSGPGLPRIAALMALSSGRPAPFEAQGLLAGGSTLLADGEPFAPVSVDEYFRELPLHGVPLESLGALQERLRRGRSLERN
jgi:hypothetical protein